MALFKKKSIEEKQKELDDLKRQKFASIGVATVEATPPMPKKESADRELRSEDPVKTLTIEQRHLIELVKSINLVYGGYTSPVDVSLRPTAELNAEVLVLLLGIFDNISQCNESLKELVRLSK